jgi:hypothetical protein
MLSTDPDRIHWPDLVQEGVAARKQIESAQWRLGDLAGEVVTNYGAKDLEKYVSCIGVEYGTLLNYRRVAKRFTFSRRRENLSWSHHERLAASKLSPDEQDEWLFRAETEAWTVRRLAAKVEANGIRKRWEVEHQEALADLRRVPPSAAQGSVSASSVWLYDLAEAQRFCEALRVMASMKLLPADIANVISVEQAIAVDKSIEDASRWLAQFVEAWQARWANGSQSDRSPPGEWLEAPIAWHIR